MHVVKVTIGHGYDCNHGHKSDNIFAIEIRKGRRRRRSKIRKELYMLAIGFNMDHIWKQSREHLFLMIARIFGPY